MNKHIPFKRFLSVFILFSVMSISYAYEFQVNGIFYNFNSDGAGVTVTYDNARRYSGSISIPSQVTYDSKTYNVTSIGNYAFSGCSGLISITIPNSVTSIGEGAFSGSSGLTSVTIPNSVKSIGEYAFHECEGMTSITISNSVTSIGYEAFDGCSGLTSITIPNSVTSIGDNAFYGCSSLTSVIIGNGVTSIGPNTFYGCSSLTSVTIGNNVTNIGFHAFYRCSSLTKAEFASIESLCKIEFDESANPLVYAKHLYINGREVTDIVIPNSVTSIREATFANCSSLTSVTISNSVTSIGYRAFYNCSGLTSVAIPNSVTSIGSDAFEACSSLTSITIPNSVTSIGSDAFKGCSSLTTVTLNSKNIVSETYTSSRNLKTIFGTQVKKYFLGDDIKVIGNYAFYDCSNLTSITIPNSVTSIESQAFKGCSNLTFVTLNSNSIVSKTYTSSSNLGSIFGAQVKKYVLGDNVKNIGDNAFYGCSSLTSVTIGNSVTSIGEYAFYCCRGLTSVIIPNSVTSIGKNAFYSCSGLTAITISNSVTGIENGTFDYCRSLTSVTIPNSVTYIGNYAFEECSSLTTVTIPNSVTSIGSSAFSGCSGLTSVTIPNGVTSIGSSAFKGCSSLTSVTIGNSVNSIGYWAFYGCRQLTEVSCLAVQVPSADHLCFSGVPFSMATLYVPASSINAYKSASEWQEFVSILPISIPATGISLNQASATLTSKGQTLRLTATVTPSNATNKSVTWSSSNKSVATVSSTGLVTAVSSGTATITATTADGSNKTATCTITVAIPVPATGITLSQSSATLTSKGQTLQLSATVTPSNATNKSVTWSSSNTNVATVDTNGLVTAVANGSATITATTDDGSNKTATCTVTVNISVPATSIALSQSSATLTSKGQTLQLSATVTPSNATDKSVTWSSSNTSVATVSSTGLVTAVSSGTATITATTADGSNKTATCTVAVNISVPATGISLSQTSATLTSKGQTLQLIANVIPSNATNKSVTWTSSDTSIATVSSTGLVTAVSGGIVTITATTADGSNKTATCTVTVDMPVSATGISLSQTSATLTSKGQTLQLSATITPSNATNKSVTWSSSNTSVATVSSTGLVTAVMNGSATITVKTADGSNKTATCLVMVNTSNGIVIDGIFYILDSSTKEATVTYTGVDGSHVSSYAGHINIPSTVTYNNVRYSVTSIGEYAFNECVKLASVTIPETISNISNNAFNGCTGLTTVTINANEIVSKDYDPPTVNGGKNIGTLFGSQVKKFIIGNNVTSIGADAFRGCNLTSVTIGNNVTTIGMSAFRECTNLLSVTIPNSVTDINIYAFLGCWALKSVTIGKSVTTMSGYTFYECKSLTSITCEALNVPTVTGSNCFKDVPSSAILYVPASSIDAYRSTAPWSDFGTIESHYSKTPVHNVGELQSGQVYTAETRRAAWYVPEEGTQLLTTVYPTSVENNQYDSGQQFAFIKWNDNIYIYCVGEQKILNGITSNTPNNGVLVTEDCQPVTIKETGDTDYPFFFTFGDNYNINVGGGNQITIDKWTTFDDGNKVALRPVHGVMIDEDEMWRIIAYIEGNSVLENHYSQAPVQNVGELINDRQVYTAETRRAAWYVPAGNTQLETTEVPAFEYKNSSNRSQQFAFIKHKGQYYIYCVGEGKILNGKTSNSPSRGVLVTEDCQPVTIRETGDSYYPLFFSYGENYNVNIGGGNQITIDRWSTIDDGNKVALRPVQGVVIDDKEMRRIIEYIDGYITGDSNGNGEVEIGDVTSVLTLMATPEATGYNNKAADANGNGEIEIGDVTTILTIMAGN